MCVISEVALHTTRSFATMSSNTRGGARRGAGRKKLDKAKSKQLNIRIPEHMYDRWKDFKVIRGAKTDAELFGYMLDLADSADHDASFRYCEIAWF